MTDAQHRKSFAASRRSILKGLGVAAIGITLTGKTRRALADEEKKLNFYNWDTYIGETTLEDFKNASGIDVNMSLFATNDELFAKLRAGNPGYDVIVPGNEFVEPHDPGQPARTARSRKDPEHQEYLARVHQRRALRSRPQILDALYLARHRHRLSQVQGQRRPRQLEVSLRFRPSTKARSPSCPTPTSCSNWFQISRQVDQQLIARADQAGRGAVDQAEAEHQVFHEDNGQDLLRRGRCRHRHGI